jgi:D-inositol-3-phosphate glycosyltransferase
VAVKNYRVAIIDPVGRKAGMDHYDLSLAIELNESEIPTVIFSNFNSTPFTINQFRFSFGQKLINGIILLISFLICLVKCRKMQVQSVILHIFHAGWLDKLFAALVKRFGLRLIIIVHDIENSVRRGSELKDICKKSDSIVVHNQFCKIELLKKIKTSDQHKVKIIPHGHFIDLVNDSEVKLPFDFKEGIIYLLFFGNIKESKGLDVLLESMKILPDKVHLAIAGRDRNDYSGLYFRTIDDWNLRDRVHIIMRYITNDERNTLFRKCTIAVLPYKKIYQSGVLLMAMSYHLPVVASNLKPNQEIINEKNGLLFVSEDAKDLAAKILAMTDTSLQNKYTASAFEFVQTFHNWKDIASAFASIV